VNRINRRGKKSNFNYNK